MNRLFLKTLIASVAALAAIGIALPALAYTDTTPGAGGSSTGNPKAGGSTTVTFTFPDLAPGTIITFSSSGNTGSCAPSYSAASGPLNASHQVAVTVTFPAGCAGQSPAVIGTAPNGETLSVVVAIAGGFPNTSALLAGQAPWWLPIGIGLALIAGGIAAMLRQRRSTGLAAA